MIYWVSHFMLSKLLYAETLWYSKTKVFLKILATNTKKKRRKKSLSRVVHCIVHSLYSRTVTLSLGSHFRLVKWSAVVVYLRSTLAVSERNKHTHTHLPTGTGAPGDNGLPKWIGESTHKERRVRQRKWHLHYANDIIESDGRGGRQTVKEKMRRRRQKGKGMTRKWTKQTTVRQMFVSIGFERRASQVSI